MRSEALASESRGAGARVVLVHGFTQTRRCWGDLPDRLAAEGFEVVAVDAPGHGDSSAVRADLWRTADLLASFGPATYLGYSMGARMVLHAALAHPDATERVVLVSGTAGIEDPVERAQRRVSDDALAARIETTDVDAFLEEWLSLPLFATLAPADRDLDERRRNTAAGLASSLRLAGTGTQEPLWDRLDAIHAPALVLTGDQDVKFGQLGARLAAALPDAEHVRLAGGHTVHREDPGFADRVVAWLRPPLRR